MKSWKKYIIELEGRCVYATRNYERVRQVAWLLIHYNPQKEVIVHLGGLIVGI